MDDETIKKLQPIAARFFRDILNGRLDDVKSKVEEYSILLQVITPEQESVITTAINGGNRMMLQYLLSKVDITLIDYISDTRFTPFHFAAERGRHDLLEDLLQAGSQCIDRLTIGLRSPMHFAAENGHIKTIEFLIQRGSIAINHLDGDGNYPIHLAAKGGHLETVKYLYRHAPTNIFVLNRVGYTPLMHAIIFRHNSALIHYLLRISTDILDQPIVVPGMQERISIPQLLLRHRNISGSVLLAACASNLEDREELYINEDEVLIIRGKIYFDASLTKMLLEWC